MYCLRDIQNSCKKWVVRVFMMILTWMCACGNEHTMVTNILLDVAIQQWHGCLTHNILYPCYLRLSLLLMPIGMVFLVPLPPPLWFLLLPPLGFLLYVPPMLPCLHNIFKLTTCTPHPLDHFHSLATSYVRLLPMNIIWLSLVKIGQNITILFVTTCDY